jgi:hypothetical protein
MSAGIVADQAGMAGSMSIVSEGKQRGGYVSWINKGKVAGIPGDASVTTAGAADRSHHASYMAPSTFQERRLSLPYSQRTHSLYLRHMLNQTEGSK